MSHSAENAISMRVVGASQAVIPMSPTKVIPSHQIPTSASEE
jgi:hypothetical protein